MRLSLRPLLVAFVALALSSVTACAVEEEEDTDEISSEVKDKKDLQRFDVLTHNIGGGAENDPGAKGIAYTFSQIDERKPDVVMLEEVCASQYLMLKDRYPGWRVFFAPMRDSHPGCTSGEAKGQVLASRHAMEEEIRQDLGDVDGPKRFTLLCGSIPMPKTSRKVLSCVTHLRAAGNDEAAAEAARGRQTKRIHDLLKDRINGGQAVVLAGDLNAGPKRATLDSLYRLTRDGGFGGGLFDEADQTDPRRESFVEEGVRCAAKQCRSGEPTTENGSKLDHIFFSHNRVGGELTADAYARGGSGHRLYVGSAQLKL